MISNLISSLTETWIIWVREDFKLHNEELSIEERALSAEKCEEMIDKERDLLNQIDNILNEKIKNRK